ncbi:DUF6174 domain-containing protein [Ornithinimicrobium cryptoxanthini]|uniref:DUF6174 domain-containing protein n=1 Tax=Ornithinimicrobium cryptoxanthini TaxID=2934161 RepID=A0ABY4YHK9_9MICO|nr:DUF6174 domain-containing protein [Ornithinimicrobium cryptoxanthini]USQ76011.1 DUF6174 domain-containing protein [Ornithinimicrobium cryptoxanthini]
MGHLRPRLVAALSALVVVVGCAVEDSGAGSTAAVLPAQVGDTATWELLDPGAVSPASQWLEVGVTRLDCSGGETGAVLEPHVSVEDERIVIRIDVEKLPDGAYDCSGNDAVPVEVHLGQPVGSGDLVDAACLDGDAVDTAACVESVRWASPTRPASSAIPDWVAPPDYSFTAQSSCGERGFIGSFAVTVEGGEVTHVEPLGDSWEGVTPAMTPTITAMLDEAREALAQGGVVEVAVDDAGVPSWISLDPMPNAIDDEACYAISDYRSA